MLIRTGETRILLDAGMTVLQLQKRLSKFRLSLADIDAVFLTHEHGDHTRGVLPLSKRFGVPIFANPATLTVLSQEVAPPNWYTADTGSSTMLGDLRIESFPISHDAVDPVGYSIYHKTFKVSFITDTGTAGEGILRNIEDSDLAIVEANHDVERLIAGPYPQFLKRRILGDKGHLSNDAAADLILELVSTRRRTTCIWLGHLSDTNNTPGLARRHVQRRLSEAGCGNVVLGVALKDTASLTWRGGASYTPAMAMSPQIFDCD